MHDDQGRRRGVIARVGVTALNLIMPGLGLLRVGRWRMGAFFLAAPFFMLALFSWGMGHLPLSSHSRILFAQAFILCLSAALYIVPMILTWRASRFRETLPAWARWYALTAITIAVMVLLNIMPSLMHRFYKPFYAPSESMTPTIAEGDKFIADMQWRGPYRHGDIILFRGPDNIRVNRIAAMAGDRIAMRGGVPILNGHPVLQSPLETIPASGQNDNSTIMLTERFPDEAKAHRILDMGTTEFDDMPEIVVSPAHLFLLGDNRDRSADSRVPKNLNGVGMVSINAVIGRPLYIHGSGDHSKIGTRLDN